jgi:hypothetical protein
MKQHDMPSRERKRRMRRLYAFSAFVIIGIFSAGIAFRFENLPSGAHYWLKVLMEVSAAAAFAFVPAFFESRTRKDRIYLIAIACFAVIVAVLLYNPSEIRRGHTIAELQGEWYYDVHPTTQDLGYDAKHYGGRAHFRVIQGEYGPFLSVGGELQWRVTDRGIETVLSNDGWWSLSGSITSDDKLIYQYAAVDNGQQVVGFCTFTLKRDGAGRVTRLSGNFYRVTAPHVHGAIAMSRDTPWDVEYLKTNTTSSSGAIPQSTYRKN